MNIHTTRTSRRVIALAAASAIALGLAGCSTGDDAGSGDEDGLGTIRVGALPTPAGELLEWVDENLGEEAGLDIEFVSFTDYNTPNPALTDGSTDANLFQNLTFLETYNEQAGGELVSVGEIYLPAAAFYSDKISDISELEDGADIAIPNDPTNEGRALWMLAEEGLIEIQDGATNLDGITSNPQNFNFTEVENASLALALPDTDIAFVTASFALPAGLTQDDAILLEGTNSDYFNILATTPELENDPRIVKLVELLTDERTKEYINETWSGLIVPVD
ncbi:MetQ/NlpA family ABC transporter substrate-binding protein [Humidisolicoccus flavus]|uniref:MetQ/NlpA family ABC transporter substrate-binding protein n=1 Tax=Humidisolicoccus flavus TaxID=3111414 RepID=UPI00324BC790